MSHLNFQTSSVPESRKTLPSPQQQLELLKSILAPVAHEVAAARETTNGIVVVVHNPGSVAKRAMKKVGAKVRARGTSVFGLVCSDAVAALGHDLVTRRWCGAAPNDGQIKVFLIAGDGTALLTLNFTDEGIKVEKEPDVYPV